MLSREALVARRGRERFQERWAPPRVFSLTVDAKVPASRNSPNLPLQSEQSLGSPAVGSAPNPPPTTGGLHKVVGDLPLVLEQVFRLSAVGITCGSQKVHTVTTPGVEGWG